MQSVMPTAKEEDTTTSAQRQMLVPLYRILNFDTTQLQAAFLNTVPNK